MPTTPSPPITPPAREFTNNHISYSGSGIHTDNSGDSGGAVADLIRGNEVTLGNAGSYGVWVFVPYLDVTVDNNTVTDNDIGLGAFGGGGGVVNFTGNTVDYTTHRANSIGALVSTTTWYCGEWNVSATFSGANAISNADYGILHRAESDRQPMPPRPCRSRASL